MGVKKNFYCVRLPGMRDFRELNEFEEIPTFTYASTAQGAVSKVVSRANKKKVGVFMSGLEKLYGLGRDKKDVSRFAVNVSRLEDEIGVSKIEVPLSQVPRGYVLPEATDSEIVINLRKRLGGFTQDYQGVVEEYNKYSPHRRLSQ